MEDTHPKLLIPLFALWKYIAEAHSTSALLPAESTVKVTSGQSMLGRQKGQILLALF